MSINNDNRDGFFNIGYGIASIAITTVGTTIATTEAAYHGISVMAGLTAYARVTIYDSTAAAGNIMQVVHINSATSTDINRFIPVMAKKGIHIVATGEGVSGSVFYGPKG